MSSVSSDNIKLNNQNSLGPGYDLEDKSMESNKYADTKVLINIKIFHVFILTLPISNERKDMVISENNASLFLCKNKIHKDQIIQFKKKV